jgi:hypothetical protein
VLLALTEAPTWGVASARTLGLAGAGLVVIAAWVVVERRVPAPMVDISMLLRREVLVANSVQFLGLGLGTGAVFVLVPRLVATPRQYPPAVARLADYGFDAGVAVAGLYLLPLAIGGYLARDAAPALARRIGARATYCLGPAIAVATLVGLALFHRHPWEVLPILLAVGLAHAMMSGTIASSIVGAVASHATGIAIGMSVVIRQIGASVGAQTMAATLSVDTIAGTTVPADSAYTLAFGAGAVLATGAVAATLFSRGAAARAPRFAVVGPPN